MSDITPAQLAANRANAQLSTGPTSEAGRRSSLNATRHGLTGRIVVLPSEDMNVYLAFSKQYVESLNPKTDEERSLAQTIADQQWRLNRIVSVEEGMIGLAHHEQAGNFDAPNPEIHAAFTAAAAYRDQPQAFATLATYTQRLFRIQSQARKDLQKLQEQRKAEEKVRRDEAVMLYKFHKMQALSYDPQADGFVYSSAEIERESARRDRLEEAEIAHSVGYNLAAFRARMEKRQVNIAESQQEVAA